MVPVQMKSPNVQFPSNWETAMNNFTMLVAIVTVAACIFTSY